MRPLVRSDQIRQSSVVVERVAPAHNARQIVARPEGKHAQLDLRDTVLIDHDNFKTLIQRWILGDLGLDLHIVFHPRHSSVSTQVHVSINILSHQYPVVE